MHVSSLSLAEKLIGLLFLILQRQINRSKQVRAMKILNPEFPLGMTRNWPQQRQNGKVVPPTLVQVYLFCMLSIHTPVIQIL